MIRNKNQGIGLIKLQYMLKGPVLQYALYIHTNKIFRATLCTPSNEKPDADFEGNIITN